MVPTIYHIAYFHHAYTPTDSYDTCIVAAKKEKWKSIKSLYNYILYILGEKKNIGWTALLQKKKHFYIRKFQVVSDEF